MSNRKSLLRYASLKKSVDTYHDALTSIGQAQEHLLQSDRSTALSTLRQVVN